jgi:chorismate lyase
MDKKPKLSSWHALDALTLADHPLYPWLACQHSLTEELSRHLGSDIQVHVLKEYRKQLNQQERLQLCYTERQNEENHADQNDIDEEQFGNGGFVRDIILQSDGIGYIGARTIMSEATWNHCQLAALGNTPIGTLLFDNPLNSQRHIEVQSYPELHSSQWSDFLSIQNDKNQPIWARRSVFMLQQQPIIIHELFSDRLLD